MAQQALDLDTLKVVLAKKVVGPRAKREAVCVVREEARLSEQTRLWADRDAPRELAVPAEGTERSGVAGSATRVGRRASAIRLSAAVHFPAPGEDRGWNAAVACRTTSECIGCTGRKGWRCSVGSAGNFGLKRGYRGHFRRVQMRCGRWTTRMTKWPAGGNSEHWVEWGRFSARGPVDRTGHVAARSACGAVPGGAARTTWNTGGNPSRRWNGVHQPRCRSIGLSESGGAALHRARQARAERVHRKLQREVAVNA